MQNSVSLLLSSLLLMATLAMSACSDTNSDNNKTSAEKPQTNAPAQTSSSAQSIALDVYKSPTCGCCELWVEHVNARGFSSKVQHPDDLNAIKDKFGIKPQYQSCHTAVSKEGYVFEGHIPARLVKQFLAEKPDNAIGLAVPGMPLGSPGMEVGDRITPYDVLLLQRDGTTRVYATISTLEK